MIEGRRRSFALLQCDRDVLIANRDAAIEFKLLLQSKSAFPPFCALPRTRNCEAKMPDGSNGKWDERRSLLGHINYLLDRERITSNTPENRIFIESKAQ